MTLPTIRFKQKSCLIYLVVIPFFFSGCAELDGIFPKFNPQKTAETTTTCPAQKVLLKNKSCFLKKIVNYR